MDFSRVTNIELPEGTASGLMIDGKSAWTSEPEGLCIEVVEPNLQVMVEKVGSPNPIELVYSLGGEFMDLPIGQYVRFYNKGEKMWIRAKNQNATFSKNMDNRYHIKLNTGKANVTGNLQYLLDCTGQRKDAPANCYAYLFGSNYHNMLEGPELTATELGNCCYDRIFSNVQELKSFTVHFTAWGTDIFNLPTNYWCLGVPSTGDFYCPEALPEKRGSQYMPDGWTIHRF